MLQDTRLVWKKSLPNFFQRRFVQDQFYTEIQQITVDSITETSA